MHWIPPIAVAMSLPDSWSIRWLSSARLRLISRSTIRLISEIETPMTVSTTS